MYIKKSLVNGVIMSLGAIILATLAIVTAICKIERAV